MAYDHSIIPTIHFEPPKEENTSAHAHEHAIYPRKHTHAGWSCMSSKGLSSYTVHATGNALPIACMV